jgi:hypothetical protein
MKHRRVQQARAARRSSTPSSATPRGKTFGSSDLDEAYYYRNLSEYERDKAATRCATPTARPSPRRIRARADSSCDAIYIDPPDAAEGRVRTAKMHHLRARSPG